MTQKPYRGWHSVDRAVPATTRPYHYNQANVTSRTYLKDQLRIQQERDESFS